MSVVDDFAELFQGRTDAYGEERGGCVRLPMGGAWSVIFEEHLDGTEPIGVYPIVANYERMNLRPDVDLIPEWEVRWGCVDFDVKTKGKPSWDYENEDDAHIAAHNLQRVLAKLGITAWIERTRSYGRHVWVFSEDWVPARTMRRALKFACKVADVSDREVNPKQESLAEGQLGNYVRLPYPGALQLDNAYDETRVMLVSVNNIWPKLELHQFVERALESRTCAVVLDEWAQHWHEPETPKAPIEYISPSARNSLTDRLSGLAYTMWRDGPIDAKPDRSKWLLKFAHKCRESGLDMGEAYTLLSDVDLKVGKFTGRADREQRLQDIVRSAYR